MRRSEFGFRRHYVHGGADARWCSCYSTPVYILGVRKCWFAIFRVEPRTRRSLQNSDNFLLRKCHSRCSELNLLNLLTMDFLIVPMIFLMLLNSGCSGFSVIFNIAHFGLKEIGLRFWWPYVFTLRYWNQQVIPPLSPKCYVRLQN